MLFLLNEKIIIFFITLFIMIILWNIFDQKIVPFIIEKRIKDIELNPKWIVSKTENFYGFSDLDFVIVESPLGMIPRFRISKDKKRLQLLISEETTTKDVEDIMRIALIGKIKINYGLWFPDKSLCWLSILCYMLDGGDVKIE